MRGFIERYGSLENLTDRKKVDLLVPLSQLVRGMLDFERADWRDWDTTGRRNARKRSRAMPGCEQGPMSNHAGRGPATCATITRSPIDLDRALFAVVRRRSASADAARVASRLCSAGALMDPVSPTPRLRRA